MFNIYLHHFYDGYYYLYCIDSIITSLPSFPSYLYHSPYISIYSLKRVYYEVEVAGVVGIAL
jgi:hypothetical protein